jgi:Do/DeqQ family serine protease
VLASLVKFRLRFMLMAATLLFAACLMPVFAETLPPIVHANSFAPLVEKTAPAVVNIYAQKIVHSRSATRFLDGSAFWQLFRDTLLFGYGKDRIQNSLGSGVIVTTDGVIVTNHHVVADAEGIAVALADGRVFKAGVELLDAKADIAVLRISTGGDVLPFLEFGDSDMLRVGDQVIAIGDPFGIGQTVTSGIVSGLARTAVGVSDFQFFIQTDAAINPGNSGGAQVDMSGRLVGINTSIYSTSGGSEGLGFAVPSNMVRSIVESVVRHKPLARPWIGLSGRSVPQQLARSLGLNEGKGVLVTGLHSDGPAASAGVHIGDIVLALDGFPVNELQALRYRIATRGTGGTSDLLVFRAGRAGHFQVALVAPPDVPPANRIWAPSTSPLRGARLASLSPAFAEDVGLDSALSGVLVLEADRGSGANRMGLNAGDIIREVNNQQITAVDEVLDFRKSAFQPWSLLLIRAGQKVTLKR